MMDIQLKQKWEPIENLSYNYGLVHLIDNEDGLEILLSDRHSGDILKIIFRESLLYRNIDDIYYLNASEPISSDVEPWEFFIIKNSEFKRWFKEQDLANFFALEEIIHYGIYTMDDCIDILVRISVQPEIEFIAKNK